MRDEQGDPNFFAPKPDMIPATSGILPTSNVWQETYAVRSYEVDCRSRLSILSIFNFLQEAASKHAEALGVSIQQLFAENYTWLLSRLKIKIDAFPALNDQIQVNTWPSGTQRLFALRDFALIHVDDRPIAVATSAWLVIDLQKRRPVRIAPFLERLKPLEGAHILTDTLAKLPGLKQYTYEHAYQVRYRDLDINQHVNNVSFVEWIVESIPKTTLASSLLSEMEINFLAEAFESDRILARCQPHNSTQRAFDHSIIREQDGQELARARTNWREID
jgi:acyl-ACP thioesterase